MWGHRKIAWLCRHQHGIHVADATCLRILREAGLTLPIDYVRERRDLAAGRREAFVELPTRRNRVWQMDFFELETSGGGTWRSGDVIDYATKLVLAGPVTPTQTHRDAIPSVQAAIDEAERLLGGPLIDDLPVDPDTGETSRSSSSPTTARASRPPRSSASSTSGPSSSHIRTRRRSPQTNGVIERYHGAIKIEQLWRDLPADGTEMTAWSTTSATSTTRPPARDAPRRPADRALPRRPRPGAPTTVNAPLPTRQTMRIP